MRIASKHSAGFGQTHSCNSHHTDLFAGDPHQGEGLVHSSALNTSHWPQWLPATLWGRT